LLEKQKYYELRIYPEKSLNSFLELANLFGACFEEDGKGLILRDEKSLNDIKSGFEKFAKKISVKCEFIEKICENEDWIAKYKAGVKPIEIPPFYIHPTWTKPKAGRENIIVNPALAFGSGHHESTQACIQMLAKYVKKDKKVLDLGCGSGILALSCAKIGAQVTICDNDQQALESSFDNFLLNSLTFLESTSSLESLVNKKYDIILANIVADVLLHLASDLKEKINKNGILILSGILEKYENKILAKFEGFELLEKVNKNTWLTIVLKENNKDNN